MRVEPIGRLSGEFGNAFWKTQATSAHVRIWVRAWMVAYPDIIPIFEFCPDSR
jgi:hypothetical protein